MALNRLKKVFHGTTFALSNKFYTFINAWIIIASIVSFIGLFVGLILSIKTTEFDNNEDKVFCLQLNDIY